MVGWLVTALLWAAVVVRLRKRQTQADVGLLVMFTGMAIGFTLARPELVALIDAGGFPLSSLLKRCTAMAGAVGVALYMSAVAGRAGWLHIPGSILMIVTLIGSYLAGADRWRETDVFFADASRFTMTTEVWAGWVHFLTWYAYVALVCGSLAATCIAAAMQTGGVLRTQLLVFSAGTVLLGLSPVYAVLGLFTVTSYDLGVDRMAFLSPGVLLLVAGMAWQPIHRLIVAVPARRLHAQLGGLWRLLSDVEPGKRLPVEAVEWPVLLHRRVVEIHDWLRALSAYLPDVEPASGRVTPEEAAGRVREALAARLAGQAPRASALDVFGKPEDNVAQEAKWLIRMWRAWLQMEKELGPVEAGVSPGR
ncbi:MAB_1171c family putative transporter [Nonomuraea dietziae]|uniref:MAB_1171c family putative transporter n=1 Tax=Nonomuraea dietziae TaxID=65515 RepID=UPI0033F713C0